MPQVGNELIKGIRKPTTRTKTKGIHLASGDNNEEDEKSTALYCDASIKNIRIPLIIDSGSAGRIISLSLLKDLGFEIDRPSNTVMVNVNGERRRPLGAVTKIPLNIQGRIIPFNAIVTEAASYSAIVGNDWLRKTKAKIDYEDCIMTLTWEGEELTILIESEKMPHYRVTIEKHVKTDN